MTGRQISAKYTKAQANLTDAMHRAQSFVTMADNGDILFNGKPVYANELYPLATSVADLPTGSLIASAVSAIMAYKKQAEQMLVIETLLTELSA